MPVGGKGCRLFKHCCKKQNFPYFRYVNKKATIRQQLTAGFLLAVLLFISVARLLHSHDTTPPAAFSGQAVQVSASAECAVCDYHFTKDTDHHEIGLAIETPLPVTSFNCCYQSRTTSSIGLNYADRGPPSLA